MSILTSILCLLFITLTAVMLYKKYNPQGVLIIIGITMFFCSFAIGLNPLSISKPTGNFIFDLIRIIEEKFLSNISRAGLMIMTIGGYVAFMNKIKATDALVYIAVKPLAFFKKYPYIASIMAIPIGQMLFITTPSAAGIGLLLVASIYPVLTNLGVSKLTALSVISAATLFDQGPGSANTALASELIGITAIEYFMKYQIVAVVPTTLVIMTAYYFNNKYFDKKDLEKGKSIYAENLDVTTKPDVPLFFAILPLLPLTILIVFSEYLGIFNIKISTTLAMLFSLLITVLLLVLHLKSIKKAIDIMENFWKGMGNVFSSVVTLIVSAEIFSSGLISLGFIDSLVFGTTHLGFSGTGITILIAMVIFLAAMLMGSGNAAFFSFGPLMPDIASTLGLAPSSMILPMQLSASMGRAASPIAGVIVAIAGVAGVSPVELAKRNMIPLFIGVATLFFFHFLIN